MIFSTCFGSRLQKAKDRFVQVAHSGRLRKGYSLCAIVLVMIMVGSLLVSCSQGEQSSNTEENSKVEESFLDIPDPIPNELDSEALQAMATAYLDIINDLENTYGGTYQSFVRYQIEYYITGAYRLLDFDGDSVPELYCSYTTIPAEEVEFYDWAPNREVIYRYNQGTCEKVWDNATANLSREITNSTSIFIENHGRIYLRWGEYSVGDQGQYYTLIDGKMEPVLSYDFGRVSETENAMLNGESVEENTLRQTLNTLEQDGRMQFIQFYGFDRSNVQLGARYNQAVITALEKLQKGETPNLIDASGTWTECVPRPLSSTVEPVANDPLRTAYCQVVADLKVRYNMLMMAKLIDFDGDGTAELYCSFRMNDDLQDYPSYYREQIYQYRNNSAVKIYQGEVFNKGLSVQPGTRFHYKDNKVYLMGSDGGTATYHYKELIDGKMQEVFNYCYYPKSLAINGTPVSREDYDAQLSAFLGDGITERYPYEYSTETSLKPVVEDIRTVPVSTPSADPDHEQRLAAYRQVVTDLEAEHGKTTGNADGLSFVKLIDLDGDGIQELFCSWAVTPFASYTDEIYQWQNGQAVQVYTGRGYNKGTSTQPSARFFVGEDIVYILYGHEMDYEYKALIDGSIQTVATEHLGYAGGLGGTFTFNGEPCAREEYEQYRDDLLNGMEDLNYHHLQVSLAGQYLVATVEEF